MPTKDFKARQLRTNQVINSGSSLTSPLLIYGLGSATNDSGGFTAANFVTGSNTWLYISGAIGSALPAGTSYGTVTFGGDVQISGTLYGGNISAGGSPGGANTQIQYNADGAFDGKSTLTFASGTDTLAVTNALITSLTASFVTSSGNFLIAGDVAINGGDLVTAAATFNLVNSTATTVYMGGAATTIGIGAASGRTTVYNDLAIATGNIIGAPGAGANVMTLLSSGNIVAKLDVDNNAAGHKFIVQDYTGASQFSVGENGNAELTGSLDVTGSITALAGFSGSLTKLSDGSDYLLQGSNVLLSTGSSGAVTINSTTSTTLFAGAFGDGSDGDGNITGGTTTLTRPWHYNNLTITGTGILKPRGFNIFVKGTLTINAGGSINDNGIAGGTGISGGTALSIVNTGFGAASGAGGAGRTTTGVGNSGATSSNCSLNNVGQPPIGGVGGGVSAPVLAGGTPGSAPSPTILQKWNSLPAILTGRTYNGSSTFNGGSGGGGGGCDLTGGTGTSGNGGSGGGIVHIGAKTIINNGSITANGGAGGNGVATGTASCGGGAGGGGGLVALITTTTASYGTITANAGAVGTGAGVAPTAATVGQPGSIAILVLA